MSAGPAEHNGGVSPCAGCSLSCPWADIVNVTFCLPACGCDDGHDDLTAQMPLPLPPVEGVPIGDAAALVVDEVGSAVWVWGSLWWSWKAGDETGRRLAAVQLVAARVATRVQVAAAFGVTTVTVWRWQSDYAESGVAGLVPARSGPKGAWKVTGEVADRIMGLHGQGCSQQQIADQVGVSRFSVRRVLAQTAGPGPVQGEADTVEGPLPAVPAPVPRTGERQAARFGQLTEAVPVFTEGIQLPLAGLLLAVPGLEATGLLEVAGQVYGRLRNGFYGLRSVLLTLVMLALLREPRAEGARSPRPIWAVCWAWTGPRRCPRFAAR